MPPALPMVPPPRALPLFVTGTLFTALFLAAPLAHHALRPHTRDVVLLALPLVVLLIALARPHPFILYAAFPMSHLPLIALRPELASPTVYRSFWPLAAVALAGAAYLVATTRRLDARRFAAPSPRQVPLLIATAIVALAPLLAFMLPALRRDVEPQTAALTAVLAPIASWYGAARLVPRLVVPPLLSPNDHALALAVMERTPRPRRGAFIVAALLAVLALTLAAAWYALAPTPPKP